MQAGRRRSVPENLAAPRRLSLTSLLSGAALAAFASSPLTASAEEESRAGHGSVSIGYQYQTADSLQATTGEMYIGDVDTHALNVELEYHLTNKLTLVAGLPYVHRRYLGPYQHDPLALDPPRPEIENIDQGQWNNAFQDFRLGARYLVRDAALSIEPFVFLEVPSHEYPFFGNAAVGQHQTRLHIGSSFFFAPGLSDAYYGVDVGYEFVERVLGISVDHWRITAEAGYFFTPRLNGRVFTLIKKGHGLDFPDDFPGRPFDERWYQHDRLVKHSYTNVGLGLTWAINEKYQLTSSWMKMTRAEIIHKMDYAVDVTLAWSF
jgi:hypothetical protein